MRSIRVNSVLADPILVSRESARLLEGALRVTIEASSSSEPLVIDFEGVSGVAPSFLDELLSIFEAVVRANGEVPPTELIVANPPTRLSLKFEAIARGHGMSVQSIGDGAWTLKAI